MYKYSYAEESDIFRLKMIADNAVGYVGKKEYFDRSILSDEYLYGHIEDKGFTLVAIDEGEIIGYIVIHCPYEDGNEIPSHIFSEHNMNLVAQLKMCVVDPKYWGEGIMKTLTSYAELELRNRYKYVAALVPIGYRSAVQNFAQCSFKVADISERNGIGMYVFEKQF